MPTQTELDALESFGLDLSDLTLDRSTFIGILKDRYRLFALDMHPDKNLNNPQATRIYQRMQSQYVVLLELAESLTANPSQAEQGTKTERNFGQFGKRYPSTDDDEYDSPPNVSFPLPEAGTRLEWESLLVTVEIQGTSYRYRDKLPLCKWNFYAPVVIRTFFDQLHQQGIPMKAALKHASVGVSTVVLTGSDGGKPMFFHALFQTISEYEHRLTAGLGESIMDRYYSVLYYGSLEFAVGWSKFLLTLEIPDSAFIHAVCGVDSAYTLRADSVDFYREILWHYLLKKRYGTFKNIVSRLMLSTPLGNHRLSSFISIAEANNRLAWNLKFRDTIKNEKLYSSQSAPSSSQVQCISGSHTIRASKNGPHLISHHKELTGFGWVACDFDPRCVYDTRVPGIHAIRCPYRTRPIVDSVENKSMKIPNKEPLESIPDRYRRFL